MNMQVESIESHKAFWTALAKQNGWYAEPFGVQFWMDDEGQVVDSVSWRGLTEDIIIRTATEPDDE